MTLCALTAERPAHLRMIRNWWLNDLALIPQAKEFLAAMTSHFALLAASGTLLLSIVSIARAQEVLDEVIVTANQPTSVGKLDVPLKDQPQNVSVISRQTLDSFGSPRVEDIAYSTVGMQAVAPAQG